MADLLKGENSGVRVDFKASDSYAGGETSVVYQVVNPTGDWEVDKPTDEWQRYDVNGVLGYDTESCTDFSCMNSIEYQIDALITAGSIPDTIIEQMHELGYFDANNKINFNDWFNANTAGTTAANGNTLQATWDAVRKYGLLPQGDGFGPNDFTDAAQWFDATKITPAMYAKALQFLTIFDINYEWIFTTETENQQQTMEYHLKQAPLHVLVPTCNSWNNQNEVIQDCGVQSVNHAIICIGINPGVSYKVYDQYTQFVKELAWNYYMPYVLKGVVTLKTTPTTVIHFTYVFNTNLKYGMPAGGDVTQLQTALQYLGYMTQGQFGPFGPATKLALGKFQTASGITDPDGQGTNFGPQTRTAMNAALQ
jgi:hypothetical protein